MSDDAKTEDTTTPEGEGPETTPAAGTVSDADSQIASYRKRQAGAEAARQIAEKKAADLEAELTKYREANQSAAEKELSELAATKARLEAAEQRAAQAEAKAEARILDAKYPNARKELPEVVDEAKLAKIEALLADEEEDPVPTPLRHNGTKTSAPGTPAKEETAADVEARLLATPVPWAQ